MPEEDAIALTKKMDALLRAKDLDGIRAMYHPEVESVKPNGDVIRGIEANFAGFSNLVRMFPDMVYVSSNFEADSDDPHHTCSFDTVTECNNAGPNPPANSVYKIKKRNTFRDGLLVKIAMEATETCVICRTEN